MKMKVKMVSFMTLAILTLCLLNVASASMSNLTTAPYCKIVTDVKAQQPTTITLTAPQQATVNEWFSYSVSLTAGGTGVIGATIHTQVLKQGTWVTIGDHITDKNGGFIGQLLSKTPGERHLRAVYDGSSQYAPSISNEVVITVS